MWAFGLLLYEIYVGVDDNDHPLQPLDYDDLQARAVHGRLIPTPLPVSCPAPVHQMCMLCFAQEPDKRASVRELLAIVDAWSVADG